MYLWHTHTHTHTHTIGASDQMKQFDVRLWIEAMNHESEPATHFLPAEFEEWADDILYHDFALTRNDISPPIVRDLYCYLSHQEPPSFS